jgi:hypothetical protein
MKVDDVIVLHSITTESFVEDRVQMNERMSEI